MDNRQGQGGIMFLLSDWRQDANLAISDLKNGFDGVNRQSDVYEREGIDLDVSTLADWVGAASATLMPLVDVIQAHVFAAKRIHADDTPVPVLAKGKTRTARLWTYVRDDRPFGGPDPPAALFFYSRDRSGVHPEQHLRTYAGLMQADAYAGYNRLYEQGRKPAPIVEAACWAHARRKFFDLARIMRAPIAVEAIARIDALFAIERQINGAAPERRIAVRCERSKPLIDELETWLRQQRDKLSSKSETARPSTTASNDGLRSRASSTTVGSACPTMPPNARYCLLYTSPSP